ncbi:hypothetical protein PRZ48_012334 [Zasmidium cellare]|uniref:Uncharacterized protein n=1 Tax=Zasmidium cellare TaxID=395010 RepID=A0ABR0E4K5_ZASCE|nr:hypothetical protein PRZ48_012334 [Zasmidium cellare]
MACERDRPQQTVKDRKDSMLDIEKPDISVDRLCDLDGTSEDATNPGPFDVDTPMEDSMLSYVAEFGVEAAPDDVTVSTPDSFEVDTSMEEPTLIYDISTDYNTSSPITKPATDEVNDSPEDPQQPLFDTAAQKVFATNALVERILLNLPDIKSDKTIKKIFTAQRINKTVQKVVRRSFKVRRMMMGRKERMLRARGGVEGMGSRTSR